MQTNVRFLRLLDHCSRTAPTTGTALMGAVWSSGQSSRRVKILYLSSSRPEHSLDFLCCCHNSVVRLLAPNSPVDLSCLVSAAAATACPYLVLIFGDLCKHAYMYISSAQKVRKLGSAACTQHADSRLNHDEQQLNSMPGVTGITP